MSTAVLSPSEAPPQRGLVPRNNVVLLHGISWEEDCRLRDDPENRGVRMYYGDGELLLMTTGSLHERLSYVLGLLLLVWSEHSDTRVMCFGRWTLKQDLKKKGLEADNCYHVRHVPYIQQKKHLDLTVDPAPDLAIEVDITTHSDLKLAIHAALGVPEVWIWAGSAIDVRRLNEGEYEPQTGSVEVPDFPFDMAASFAVDHLMDDEITVMRTFRETLQTHE